MDDYLLLLDQGGSDFLKLSTNVLESFEMLTIVFGTTSLLMALSLAIWFARSPHGLARAVAYDKFAEAVSMSVFLIFSVSYYLDLFVKMPIICAVLLRLTAMGATMFSSAHLGYQAWKVIKQDNSESEQ